MATLLTGEDSTDAIDLRLLTAGCPLRQLYAQRFPTLYACVYACVVRPCAGATATTSGPDPDELAVTRWFDIWGAGDYVGRWLWSNDELQPAEGTHHDQRCSEASIGDEAHTHYFELERLPVRKRLAGASGRDRVTCWAAARMTVVDEQGSASCTSRRRLGAPALARTGSGARAQSASRGAQGNRKESRKQTAKVAPLTRLRAHGCPTLIAKIPRMCRRRVTKHCRAVADAAQRGRHLFIQRQLCGAPFGRTTVSKGSLMWKYTPAQKRRNLAVQRGDEPRW